MIEFFRWRNASLMNFMEFMNSSTLIEPNFNRDARAYIA